MEGKPGEEFEAAAIDYIKRHPARRTSASSSTATAIRRNGSRRPSAAGWRTTAPRPTRCPASSTRRASRCSSEFGVLTEAEVRSRYEVKLEKYNKLLNIEVAHHEAHGAPRLPACHQRLCRRGRRQHHRHQERPARGADVSSSRKSCCRSSLAGIKEIDAPAGGAATSCITPSLGDRRPAGARRT